MANKVDESKLEQCRNIATDIISGTCSLSGESEINMVRLFRDNPPAFARKLGDLVVIYTTGSPRQAATQNPEIRRIVEKAVNTFRKHTLDDAPEKIVRRNLEDMMEEISYDLYVVALEDYKKCACGED